MKKLLIMFALSVFLSFGSVRAVYDPLSVPNNRFGIHVADPNDIEKVGELVNTNGGDWGYVTIVIPEHERKIDVWRPIFERMARDQLIPIVRLATHVEGGVWVRPSTMDAAVWTDFLERLPWPTKNRYIVLFNEPNHAKEWGGNVSPNEYADIVVAYSQALRETSENFFILPAGLDASAPNSKDTMDEELFLRWMFARQPQLAQNIDGWTSHSYPNPGFSGSPHARGRGTIRTFEWELDVLNSLGLKKALPVFITETGWAHSGDIGSRNKISPENLAEYIKIASETVWNDPRIVAVTPFLFSYQDSLFSMFSWLKLTSREPYPFYRAYQDIAKIQGLPYIYPSQPYLALLAHPLNL